MTSIKKPLIAIASALALVTSALVAGPANAAVGFALTGGDSATVAGTTESAAIALPVPADNNVTTADVLRIDLSGLANNVTVTATATDAKLTKDVGTTVLPSAGTATASVLTGTGNSASFNVFTTTTKTGKVVLSDGTTTLATYYIKGTAGPLNNIVVSAPTAALGTTAKVTVTGTDVFGNAVSGASVNVRVIKADGSESPYTITTNATGVATQELSGLAVGTYDVTANATVATVVAGLTVPNGSARVALKVVDLAALVAEKDAEIAVLKEKLALAESKASKNKSRYNSLANKWNKKFPKSKVALLK